jgi:hypothetical protein
MISTSNGAPDILMYGRGDGWSYCPCPDMSAQQLRDSARRDTTAAAINKQRNLSNQHMLRRKERYRVLQMGKAKQKDHRDSVNEDLPET